MTDIEKEQIAAEIIAAFESTGLRPIGNSYRCDLNGTRCACAIGAVVTDWLGEDDSHSYFDEFTSILTLTPEFTQGVISGFDGYSLAPMGDCAFASADEYVEYSDGHGVGWLARAAMLETP